MATLRTRIGPPDHGRRMTLEEFREAEAQPGYLYELARGVLEVIEIPRTPHRRIVSNLYSLAALYKNDHAGIIDDFGGGMEVRIGKPGMDLARHPDLGIILEGAPLDEEGDLQAALVAEVVSASSQVRDYEEKRRDYLACGIREYWIVDPLKRQVALLDREGEGEEASWLERVVREGEAITSRLLPGLAAPVAGPWAEVR